MVPWGIGDTGCFIKRVTFVSFTHCYYLVWKTSSVASQYFLMTQTCYRNTLKVTYLIYSPYECPGGNTVYYNLCFEKGFGELASAVFDIIYTIYLSRCTHTADSNSPSIVNSHTPFTRIPPKR